MPSADEREIQTLIDELTGAWKRGDAKAYGVRFMPDGTFTNVNGEFYVGREEFDRRHAAVFAGVFRGTAKPDRKPVPKVYRSPECRLPHLPSPPTAN